MLKIGIKWPIKPISAQLPFPRVFFLRISQKLTKIAEYSYKVLQVLLISYLPPDFQHAE